MKQPVKFKRCSIMVAVLAVLAVCGCASHSVRDPGMVGDKVSGPATHKSGERDLSEMRFSTYLLFAGNCKDAMTFYRDVFGGELTLTTVGESPMKDAFPVGMHARVVNARLKSNLVDISASDWLRPTANPVRGNTVCMYLSGGRPDDIRSLFSKLSQGADVTDPLSEQPFGLYGALNDKFGNRWMFQSDSK